MAETTKLSVGKALEKLRDNEAPKSKMTRLNEKTDELKEERRRSAGRPARSQPTRRRR